MVSGQFKRLWEITLLWKDHFEELLYSWHPDQPLQHKYGGGGDDGGSCGSEVGIWFKAEIAKTKTNKLKKKKLKQTKKQKKKQNKLGKKICVEYHTSDVYWRILMTKKKCLIINLPDLVLGIQRKERNVCRR